MRVNQLLPTESGVAGDLARQLLTLNGPAIQAPDGSVMAADYLAEGGMLAAGRDTNLASLDEAFADTVNELASETEVSYGLIPRPDLSLAARHTRLLAKIRAARGGSPNAIVSALSVYDSTVTVKEYKPTDVAQIADNGARPGSDRDVYHVTVLVSAGTIADPGKVADMSKIVRQMLPSHMDFRIAASTGFILDVSQLDIDGLS